MSDCMRPSGWVCWAGRRPASCPAQQQRTKTSTSSHQHAPKPRLVLPPTSNRPPHPTPHHTHHTHHRSQEHNMQTQASPAPPPVPTQPHPPTPPHLLLVYVHRDARLQAGALGASQVGAQRDVDQLAQQRVGLLGGARHGGLVRLGGVQGGLRGVGNGGAGCGVVVVCGLCGGGWARRRGLQPPQAAGRPVPWRARIGQARPPASSTTPPTAAKTTTIERPTQPQPQPSSAPAQPRAAQSSAAQHSTAQHSTAQHSTAQRSTTLPSPTCVSAVHWNCRPSSATWAGCPNTKSSTSCSCTSLWARLITALTVDCAGQGRARQGRARRGHHG